MGLEMVPGAGSRAASLEGGPGNAGTGGAAAGAVEEALDWVALLLEIVAGSGAPTDNTGAATALQSDEPLPLLKLVLFIVAFAGAVVAVAASEAAANKAAVAATMAAAAGLVLAAALLLLLLLLLWLALAVMADCPICSRAFIW